MPRRTEIHSARSRNAPARFRCGAGSSSYDFAPEWMSCWHDNHTTAEDLQAPAEARSALRKAWPLMIIGDDIGGRGIMSNLKEIQASLEFTAVLDGLGQGVLLFDSD